MMNRKLLVPLVFVLILSCLFGWRAYLFEIYDPLVIGDDARLVLLGVLRFSNSQLFPNDLLTDYAESFVTPGVRILYFLSSSFIEPIAFSKILSFFVFVIATFFFFQLMYKITSSKISSILATLFFISISTFKLSLSGGFPRSFSLLLIICFLLFLIEKSWVKVFITLALSTVIHPLTFLLCYCTFLFSSVSFSNKSVSIDRSRDRLVALVASFAVGVLVLFPSNVLYSSPHIGKTMGPSMAKTEAVYYKGGRPGSVFLPTPNVIQASYQRLISPFALNSKTVMIDKAGFSKPKGIITRLLFLFVIFLAIFTKIKKGFLFVPKEIICHLISGIFLYLMADLVFIKIYFPERYIGSFDLISVISVFSLLNIFLESRRYLRTKFLKFLAIACVAIMIFLSSDFSKSVGMKSYSYDKTILDYIASLPNDSLIAAYPMGTADSIPLFSKRKVFVFYEASNPFHIEHWNLIKERTIQFFEAYYSDSLNEIKNFMESNKIDYLLVDLRHYQKEFLDKEQIYFNPFSDPIAEIIKKNRNSFALQRISSEFWNFKFKEKYLISLEQIKKLILSNN
jgi:hypothetical protein